MIFVDDGWFKVETYAILFEHDADGVAARSLVSSPPQAPTIEPVTSQEATRRGRPLLAQVEVRGVDFEPNCSLD